MPDRRLMLTLLIGGALVLGAGACGSSSDDGDSTASATTTSTTAAPAAPASAEVGMEGVSFTPEAITVKAGGTVTWKNTSDIAHNVTGDGYESKTLEVGDSFKHTFADAGDFEYLCTFHAGMKGIVTVQ